MWKKMVSGVIMAALKQLLDGKLVERIKALVMYQLDTDLPGPEKKAYVLSELAALGGDLKRVFVQTSANLINLAIEAAVLWAKARAGRG